MNAKPMPSSERGTSTDTISPYWPHSSVMSSTTAWYDTSSVSSPASIRFPRRSTGDLDFSIACRAARNSRQTRNCVTGPVYFSGRLILSSLPMKGIPSMFSALAHSSIERISTNENLAFTRTCKIGLPSPWTNPTSSMTFDRNSLSCSPVTPCGMLPTNKSRAVLVAGSTLFDSRLSASALEGAWANTSASEIAPPPSSSPLAFLSCVSFESCDQFITPVFGPSNCAVRSILRCEFMKGMPVRLRVFVHSSGQRQVMNAYFGDNLQSVMGPPGCVFCPVWIIASLRKLIKSCGSCRPWGMLPTKSS
mmetsp:Transcript_80732/g.229478  ORF Transcript_80732/g.229478 Transcript_80732/m.229478 type:complete len:306 (+) Transcript_80732:379-1296(+)